MPTFPFQRLWTSYQKNITELSSTILLVLLSGPLWPELVLFVKNAFMGQIDLFKDFR